MVPELWPQADGQPIDPYAAVTEYPVLEPLLAIGGRADTGWTFRHKHNRAGQVTGVQGVRIVEGSHMDVVRVISHDTVVVARSPLVGELTLNLAGSPEHMMPLLLSLPEREV